MTRRCIDARLSGLGFNVIGRLHRGLGAGLVLGGAWLLALAPAAPLAAEQERQEVIWFDGSRGLEPEGRLLSDNEFYWGEVVRTGVSYTYEVEPDSPADEPVTERRQGMDGRRLLNGAREGHATGWRPPVQPVGIRGEPLAVMFDFNGEYRFTEVDLSTPTGEAAIEIAVRDDADEPWETVTSQALEDSGEGPLHRLPLEASVAGRYMRVEIEASGDLTRCDGIWVWGEPVDPESVEEVIEPLAETPKIVGYSFQSIPGIGRSGFSDKQYWDWLRSMDALREEPAERVIWSQVPTWGEITNQPLLPDAEARFDELELLMARNETEPAAIALTNPKGREPQAATVSLSAFRDAETGEVAEAVRGELGVFGAVNTQFFGTNLVPIFEPGNMLGASLMRRFLTNAETIVDFPNLELTPAGSVVMWLSVTTDEAAPGVYEATLSVADGPSRPVRVEVLDVTLPETDAWVHSYSDMTHMNPYVYPDRIEREVDYKQGLGITVWHGMQGQPEWRQALAERAFETGRPAMLYGKVGRAGAGEDVQRVEDLTEAQRERIRERVEGYVEHFEGMGLGYEDYFLELWDEPGMRRSGTYRAIVQFIKEEVDPNVQLFMNPLFWTGQFVHEPEDIYPVLQGWYNQYIDVSVPISLLVEEGSPLMELFVADRPVNAFYAVATHHARSESQARNEYYRDMAWKAFSHGMNGWGFYSWHRRRGNPWDDHTRLPDYQMVYPGPQGAIPTRASEALRQGWEEFRLLNLLEQQDQADVVEQLVQDYRDGASFSELRDRALRAAADGS